MLLLIIFRIYNFHLNIGEGKTKHLALGVMETPKYFFSQVEIDFFPGSLIKLDFTKCEKK